MAPVPVVVFAPPAEGNAEPPRSRRRRATSVQTDIAGAAVGGAPEGSSRRDASDGAQDATRADDAPDDVAADELPGDDRLGEDMAAEDDGADESADSSRRRRRRGRRGRGARADAEGIAGESRPSAGDEVADGTDEPDAEDEGDDAVTGESGTTRRRRRRRSRSSTGSGDEVNEDDDPPNTVVHVRPSRSRGSRTGATTTASADPTDEVRGIRGSSRLEAKRQRRRDGRDNGRKRTSILTEAEFLARRESVKRVMAVRQLGDRTQIAILEDDILVEHYVTRASATSYVGNVYLGRVQNVLPSMEAAFVDIGKGRNGVLYAGEVNWDAAGLEGKARAIEAAMKSGDALLVQVTKDPIAHKGARLTSQVSLPGRFLVYVPGGGMTGISRKLPDTERTRLKAILKKIVPEDAGVIVRTAAEGASEADLTRDVERLVAQWQAIVDHSARKADAPVLVHGEPDLAIRVVRDVFNEDFTSMVVQGESTWNEISAYVTGVAPELAERISPYVGTGELFADLRVDEQLAKALDRKVWLPSGGSLVIDRTEAMTVVDVNTGKFIGSDGNLESTVTRNNLEAAEEIVRQLRLRDIGGIVVIDFIDMVLESNRDLVLRRLTECLGRDRTKHQVAEVTSLGLVQMTRKRVGEGLLEAFSEPCEHCHGRGVIIHAEPINQSLGDDSGQQSDADAPVRTGRRGRGRSSEVSTGAPVAPVDVYDAQAHRAAAAAMNAIARRAQSEVPPSEPTNDDAGAPSGSNSYAAIDADPDADAPAEAPMQEDSGVDPDEPATADAARSDAGEGAELSQPEIAPSGPSAGAAATPPQAPVAEPAASSNGARPRRRRAASRPAGPPRTADVPG